MSSPITGAPLPDPGLPAALRDLAAVLAPGTVISGRVLDALGDGMYAVQLRGRTLVAESGTPLTKGAVVQVQVDSVGDQIRARLLVGDGGAAPTAGRLQALGLPATPAGLMVLSAFERLGAPLQPDRLQVAVAQVATFDETLQVSSTSSGSAPSLPAERLADAFALLARANLPATAPLVALALRAAQGGLPNSAAALTGLRQVAAENGVTPASITAGTVTPSPPATVPAMPAGPTASPGNDAHGGVSTDAAPALRPAVVAGGGAAVVSPPASSAPSSSSPPPAGPPALGSAPPAPPVGGAPATSLLVTPVPSAPLTPGVNTLPAPASAGPAPAVIVPPPSTGQPAVPVAAAPAAVPAAATLSGPVVAIVPASTPRPVLPPAAALAPDAMTWRAVLADPLPDADRDGAAGVMRALALVGLRVKDGPVSAPTSVITVPADGDGKDPAAPVAPLVRHLAQLMPAPGGESAPRHQEAAAAPPLPAPVSEAAVRVAHEQTAQTVFPPDDLADYDRVLGLPLMANGQPVPARVAVASRNAPGGGTATFLRVDAELSRLGPVSIRLSGMEGGAMAITVIAGDAAARDLASSLPDLAEDLRRLGLTAGLRVVGDDGVERAGAVSHDG